MTAPASRHAFPKSRRIRKRLEYLHLQRIGRRRAGRRFVVITAPGATPISRIGITTSRRVGDAVVRNRVRRLVRDFFRRHGHAIAPAKDVLVIARPEAAGVTAAEVAGELGGALHIHVEH